VAHYQSQWHTHQSQWHIGSVFALRLGGSGSIPGRVILKTLKIGPNASPLDTQRQGLDLGKQKKKLKTFPVCGSAGTKKIKKKKNFEYGSEYIYILKYTKIFK